MSMRYFGYLLVSLPFIGIAGLAFWLGGLLGVLIPFGAAAVIMLLITAGVTLIANHQ